MALNAGVTRVSDYYIRELENTKINAIFLWFLLYVMKALVR
jgi:hypothetical protein